MPATVPKRLTNDRPIMISVSDSTRSKDWKPKRFMWAAFVARLENVVVYTEDMDEYKALQKAERDARKDVGGYVAGTLEGRARKLSAITGRDLVTIDADRLDADTCRQVLARLDALGCAYCYHSTRSHTPEAPRLRILIPLDRTITAEEYEPIARRLADSLDMGCIDPVSFRAHQLMYWPSVCRDVEYLHHYEDKPFMSADGVLASFTDWRDFSEWPRHDTDKSAHEQGHGRLEDPAKRGGLVGAWCKIYPIPLAIEKFLPDVYTECGDNRYTYANGSTVGGAVLYDDGAFLYSHHATDPAGGQCVNAFDLVRIHKFGGLDADAHGRTKPENMPSFKAMLDFAAEDDQVKIARLEDRKCQLDDFYPGTADKADEVEAKADSAWKKRLEVNENGHVKATARNVLICVENDPLLKDCIRHDCFFGRLVASPGLPWRRNLKRPTYSKRREKGDGQEKPEHWWAESDHSELSIYLDVTLGMSRAKTAIEEALPAIAKRYQCDALIDYFEGLPEWDGIPRVDTLLIDYLSAENTEWVRAVTRKWMVGAVVRAVEPGSKVEQMIILTGLQGQGKSTLVEKLGAGLPTEQVDVTKGKETVAELQGRWIVEASELVGVTKAKDGDLKCFLSQRRDTVRPAYGRYLVEFPRRCVFIGTTNESEFLKDATGGRRFWPVKCLAESIDAKKFDELTPEVVAQIWAEAAQLYSNGAAHYILPAEKELQEEAKRQQAVYYDEDPRAPEILAFANREIPTDWRDWDLTRRLSYWGGDYKDETIKTVPRECISIAEIMRECLHVEVKDTRDVYEAKMIGRILRQSSEWTPSPHRFFVGPGYGQVKTFRRIGTQGNPPELLGN